MVNLLPLTDATRGLVDARALARLRDDALYVSAGRGATTDTGALLAELRAGRLRAVLDVVDPEPLPPDHPLWDAPNLVLTPAQRGRHAGRGPRRVGAGRRAAAPLRPWRAAAERRGRGVLKVTGAQALVAALEAEGVEVVFGLPGVHNLALWEALRSSPIRLVGVRHEQAAAYAADGYARATGRPGVALVTTGPGAANTLGAVGEAWASRSPVVVIATEVPTGLRRAGMSLHGGVDQAAMFAPVTKHAAVAGRDRAARATSRRSRWARRRGAPLAPVYLGVPTDLLADEESPRHARSRRPPPPVTPGSRRRRSRLLRAARRPLVWAGGGALQAGAGDAVAALAARLGAPGLRPPTPHAACSRRARRRSACRRTCPRPARCGTRRTWSLSVGSRPRRHDAPRTGASRAPDVHVAVNVDPPTRRGTTRPTRCSRSTRTRRARRCSARSPRTATVSPGPTSPRCASGPGRGCAPSTPTRSAFLDAFAAALPEGAVVLADMCIPGYWLAGLGRVAAPRRLQYPMGWGTLGFAFPASLGAACAGLGPVVSVSGDGGFLFACGELATAAQERLPLTAVIVDDGGYGMLRFDQRRSGARQIGVDLRTPDFAALARSFGLRADTVDGLGDEFAAALADHVADAQPTVLVARAALQPPPTTSPRWYRPASPTA